MDRLQHVAILLAQALIAGLWQGIALALVIGLVLRLLPGTSAATRFAIWVTVLCASAAMPVVHVLAGNSPYGGDSGPVLLNPRWSYLLAGLWIGAAILRMVFLLLGAVSLRKLWSAATPLAEDRLDAANLQIHLARRTVRVCTSTEVDRPSVIGFFAPKILIPDWLSAQLSPTELRHIVLHELEHLRRRDDWLNLFQKIGLVLFPLNPAMFWIDRRLATEREIACDDGVLKQTNTPRSYAASLTSVAERRLNLGSGRRMVALALGIFGAGKLLAHRSEFARRIESILSQPAAGRPAVAAVLVAAIVGGAAAIAHTPQFVSFDIAPKQVAAAKTAPADTSARLAIRHQTDAPHFVNAALRLPETRERRTAPSHLKTAIKRPNSAGVIFTATKAGESDQQQQPANRGHSLQHATPEWLVLTSFEEAGNRSSKQARRADQSAKDDQGGDVVVPVSRVVLRTPDGRFFATPYAAVPTQAGWLIVQL